MKFIAGFITSLFAMSAAAGQIELKNGDQIGGSLKSVGGDKIVWKGEKTGEITVKKTDVNSLELTEPVKLRGLKEPCTWLELKQGIARFRCSEDERELSLMSLHDVVPYSDMEEALHKYGGKLTILGSEKTGNVNSSNWLVGSEVRWRINDFRHDFEIKYTGESLEIEPVEVTEGAVEPETTVVEYYKGFYGVNWFFLPRWYLLTDVTAEKDDAKLIKERYVYGLGSGFQWWETNKTALKFEASALQSKERYELTELDILAGTDERKDFASGRLAMDFRYKFPRDIAIFQRSNFQQSFEDSNDWRARAELGLTAPLGFGISAAFNVDYDYYNDPQEGLEKSDTNYRVGIAYSW